jgi:hypothetical protein
MASYTVNVTWAVVSSADIIEKHLRGASLSGYQRGSGYIKTNKILGCSKMFGASSIWVISYSCSKIASTWTNIEFIIIVFLKEWNEIGIIRKSMTKNRRKKLSPMGSRKDFELFQYLMKSLRSNTEWLGNYDATRYHSNIAYLSVRIL